MAIHFMAPMMMGIGLSQMFGGGWGGQMGGCCNNMMGGRKGALIGGLVGMLLGGALSGGNPFGMLAGGGLGALLGNQIGSHHGGNNCCPQHSHHGGAHCYPPTNGGHWGGPQCGSYGPPPYAQRPCCQGPPHWQHPGQHYPGHGHHWGQNCCPPRHQCCHNPGGELCQEKKGKPISYTTSGGYKVTVNKHEIQITDPSGKNTVKHWGDPHENLNGKHIKDWDGKQRSIILGDGTKLTMSATGPHGVTTNTSIYDGNQSISIDNNKNEITQHSFDPRVAARLERGQYDGETAVFRTNWNGEARYFNIYNQDENFGMTRLYQRLASTSGGKVNDLFDDPRLSKT